MEILAAQALDLEGVDFTVEPGDLGVEFAQSLLEGLVSAAEACRREFAGTVQPEEVVGFAADGGSLGFEGANERLLRPSPLAGLGENAVEGVGRQEEALDLGEEDALQVVGRDLVAAGEAGVLRRPRLDVHLRLGGAGAKHEAGEEVVGPTARGAAGSALLLGVEQSVDLGPERFGDDRVYRGVDPLALRLECDAPSPGLGAGVVRAAGPLGGGVSEEAVDRSVGELGSLPGAEPPFGEEAGDGLEAAYLEKQLVHEAPDRRLLLVRDEFPVHPAVAIDRGATEGLTKLRPDGDRGGDPGSDLLTLPLGEGGDHGVEEAASGRGGVDRLLEADEVGSRLPEEVGEVEQFAGVSGEPGELAEDEPADAVVLDVVEHPLALGVVLDRLPGDRVEAVHGDHVPALEARVRAGAGLVVLGALTLDLVLGRDPDPDAD